MMILCVYIYKPACYTCFYLILQNFVLLFMKYIDQISLNTVHDDIMCIYKPACYIVINAVLGCKKSRSNSIQSH